MGQRQKQYEKRAGKNKKMRLTAKGESKKIEVIVNEKRNEEGKKSQWSTVMSK